MNPNPVEEETRIILRTIAESLRDKRKIKMIRPLILSPSISSRSNPGSVMAQALPQPLPIRWIRKPVDSARSGVKNLPEGETLCWVEHDVIRNVTPAMLKWWFGHIDGDVTIQGNRINRYRAWHPDDHILHEYSNRKEDGTVGVGTTMHIVEMLGRRREHLIDVETEITRLDEGGFAHESRRLGLPVVKMEYHFEQVPEGTLYRNTMTVGLGFTLGKPVNRLIKSFAFDEAYAHAWIKHNIEEVGNFELFLPQLYASEV